MAPPLPAKTDESLRRARSRERVLLTVSSLGEAHVSRIARICHLPPSRIKWIMEGKPPYYAEELALIPLGLVREIRVSRGRVFQITDLGRRKARSVMAARIRARERRRDDPPPSG